jgi:DNA repair exonuclease SbcCD ATPase subunit
MMDPIQYERMMNQMKADLRKYKEDLEKEQREKAELAKKREQEQAEIAKQREEEAARFQEMQRNWEAAKAEKKRGLSEIVDTRVKPFLEGLKKDQNPTLVNNVNTFEETLNQGLDNAFMAPEQMAMFQTVEAAASQLADTTAQLNAKSSELEKMFQSDKEWSAKFEALQKEKAELEEKTAAELKAAQEEKELKEKMLEDFKKEIEQLKAIRAKNMMDTENLLDGQEGDKEQAATTQPMETESSSSTAAPPAATEAAPTTVEATASGNKQSSGYNTLYDFNGYKPRTDWRNTRRSGW